jgi:hypothetical protein
VQGRRRATGRFDCVSLDLQHILGVDIIGINDLTPTTCINGVADSGDGVAGGVFSVATLAGRF